MESVSDTESLEGSAMESASDTAWLEELAMESVSDMASSEELDLAWEECTTATPDTTEPPSSTLLLLVRDFIAHASLSVKEIYLFYLLK